MSNYQQSSSNPAIAELREFASFTAREQRYIRRSLGIALKRVPLEEVIRHWSRSNEEAYSIKAQARLYEKLDILRNRVPDNFDYKIINEFVADVITLAAFDLGQEYVQTFSAYRFLYERLLGATARPWLPSTFCGAAALPHLKSSHRKKLLTSISEAAATAPGWSTREPSFYPEWVEKVQ
jgi:hypothetical protein